MLMSLTAVCTQCLQSLSALTVASSIRKLLAACRSFRQYPPNYKITRMWANANVMATLPNIGATLCLMLQPLVGCTFTIFWGHVEEILLFNKFFSDYQYMP